MRDMYNTDADTMPQPVRSLIDNELHGNETLLWSGQPIASRTIRPALTITLLGVPWTALAVYFTISSCRDVSTDHFLLAIVTLSFVLFSLVFVFIGIGIICAPLWAFRKARRTAYVVTSKRAIIFKPGWRAMKIRSFGPDLLSKITKRLHPDGSGNLVFKTEVSASSGEDSKVVEDVGFMMVPDVNSVHRILRKVGKEEHPVSPSSQDYLTYD